jgi:hypothetical protein
VSSWRDYYNYINQVTPERSRAAELLDRATGKADALGLDNPAGEKKPGLLSRILAPLDIGRGAVYATLTELADGARGEYVSGEDWKEKFDRARYEGEGFGSTDLLRTNDDDNFLTRAAKFGGSFVADVATDPLNYVTFGGATIGKVALSGLTKSVGRKALRELPEVAASRSGKLLGDDVIDRFALDQLTKNEVADAPSVLRSLLDDPSKGRAAVEELAADRLGDVIMSGRVAGTGRTARNYLAEALRRAGVDNADDIAGDVVARQAREVRGGLRLEVPFTRAGVDLTRGAGTGADAVGLGKAADKANEARLGFRKALNRPGSIKRNFSGETGDLYGTLLNDLNELGLDALYVPGRTTAGDVSKFVKARNASRIASDQIAMAFNSAAQGAQKALNDFGDEATGRAILNAAFDGSQVELDKVLRTVDAADPRVQSLVNAGRNARRAFRAEAEALGINPDENYVPRIFSVEQAQANILEDPSWNRRTATDPAMSRQAYREKVLEQVGDDDTRQLVLRDRSNMEINAERIARGKGRMFEDDMFVILAKRGEIARARIEAAALTRELEGTGLIKKVGDGTRTTLGDVIGQVDRSLTQVFNKSPQRAKRLRKEEIEATQARRTAAARRAAAVVDGDAARAQMSDDLATLRDAQAQARQARTEAKKNVNRAQRQLVRLTKDYKELGNKQGKEAEQLRRKRDKALKELNEAQDRARESKARLVQAEAELQAAKEAPLTGSEAARRADRLPGTQRRADARDASATARQADLDAAVAAADDAASGAGRYEVTQLELDEARDEAVRALGDEANYAEVLDRVVAKQADKISRQNAELMSARYGTRAERRAQELLERREKLERAARERIEKNREADDLLTENLDKVNDLLRTESGWVEAETLLNDLIDTYAAGGASTFDIETLKAARDAVRKIPQIRNQRDEISRLVGVNYGVIADEVGANVPQTFAGYMAGQGVRDAVVKLYAANTQTQGVATALREYITPIMRIFRTYATTGRGPGYIARNGIGATVNNWLGGVKASRYPLARRIETAVHKVVTELNDDVLAGKITPDDLVRALDERLAKELSWQADDTGVTAYQLARGFLDQGVQYNRATDALERSVFDALAGRNVSVAERRMTLNPTRANMVADEQGVGVLRSTADKIANNDKILDNAWVRLWANTAEREEFFVRMAAYAEGQARYGDEVAAGLFSKSLHFDYRDLTNFEKNLKFIVPFYTWTRYNLPFQIRAAINNPGSLQRLEALSRNLALAFGDEDGGPLPDWIEERMGFLTPIGLPGGGKLALSMESPQLDLYEWGNQNPGSKVLESVNPLIKSAFELGSGRDVDTGAEVDATQIVRNVVPPAGQVMRLFGATGRDRERMASSWLSFLGVPAATVTGKQQDSILNRRAGDINARVRSALAPYLAEGEEIDGDWLIEASQRFTPEQIITLVSQGYGRRGNLDPTKPKRERRQSNRPSAGTRAARDLDPASMYLSRYLGE